MPDKNVFAFDTSPFIQGLKKVATGIGGLQKSAWNMAKNVSRGMINAVKKIGLLTLAFKGVRAAIGEMPEIGKTFRIAKNIIMKNLLFPLRKAVFPLLQKFLNWVRDNRAMFVKWGQTLVNVFSTISKAVVSVIDIGKQLLKTFGGFFNTLFGTQIKSMNELLNVLSFKFAVVVEFLKSLLEPIINTIKPIIKLLVDNIAKIAEPIVKIAANIVDIVTGLVTMNDNGNSLVTIFQTIVNSIGDIAKFAAEIVDSFITGLKPNLDPIVNSMQNILDTIRSITNELLGGTESLQTWKDIFQWIGDVAGKIIAASFKPLEVTLTGIKETINFFKGAGVAIEDFFAGGEKKDEKKKKADEKVKDAIIKPDGTIIRTDPADYLLATKTPEKMAGGGSMTINVDFTGMQIILPEATVTAAREAGESLVETLRTTLSRELERVGTK